MKNKRQYEETKLYKLGPLEGRRRVHEADHKDTIESLNKMVTVLHHMEDYEKKARLISTSA